MSDELLTAPGGSRSLAGMRRLCFKTGGTAGYASGYLLHHGRGSSLRRPHGLMLCYGCSKLLNNFIFEQVFCKWGPRGQLSINVNKGDGVGRAIPMSAVNRELSQYPGSTEFQGTHDGWSWVRLTVNAKSACCVHDYEHRGAACSENHSFHLITACCNAKRKWGWCLRNMHDQGSILYSFSHSWCSFVQNFSFPGKNKTHMHGRFL